VHKNATKPNDLIEVLIKDVSIKETELDSKIKLED
jgi:hypothetical protein